MTTQKCVAEPTEKFLERCLLYDLETEPIVKGRYMLPKMHCMVWRDAHYGGEIIGHDEILEWFKNRMQQDDWDSRILVGHNLAKFDVPVVEKYIGNQVAKLSDNEMYDTLVAGEAIHGSTLEARSHAIRNRLAKDLVEREELFPARMARKYSLESWGYRFRKFKKHADVDPEVFFAKFSEEMLERCHSDVEVNWILLEWLLKNPTRPGWPIMGPDVIAWESRLAYIVGQQERNGFGFDLAKARTLEATLRAELVPVGERLREAFGGWYAPCSGQKELGGNGMAKFTLPKKVMTRKPSTKLNPHPWPHVVGGAHTKIAWVEYNAGSGHHRIRGLQDKHGWVHDPEEVTPSGLPEMSDDVLKKLDYPEIPDLRIYARNTKLLGQLCDGKESWVNHAVPVLERSWGNMSWVEAMSGKAIKTPPPLESKDKATIHGRVNVVGARTFRMSHSSPNGANVDKDPRARSCWRPTWKWGNAVELGVDASGLELRCLANRLWPYDDGAAAEIILNGDVHEEFRKLAGLFFRRNQKTFNYAMFYGAGPAKLAKTLTTDWVEALEEGLTDKPLPDKEMMMEYAKDAKEQILKGMPALGMLVGRIKEAFETRKYIRGMRGHIIAMSTEHGGLNDVLQSDGGLVMKEGLRLFWAARGHKHGNDWAFMANVHDEWQMEVSTEGEAHKLGAYAVKCIAQAGRNFGFHVPLDGAYTIGKNWSETH